MSIFEKIHIGTVQAPTTAWKEVTFNTQKDPNLDHSFETKPS